MTSFINSLQSTNHQSMFITPPSYSNPSVPPKTPILSSVKYLISQSSFCKIQSSMCPQSYFIHLMSSQHHQQVSRWIAYNVTTIRIILAGSLWLQLTFGCNTMTASWDPIEWYIQISDQGHVLLLAAGDQQGLDLFHRTKAATLAANASP